MRLSKNQRQAVILLDDHGVADPAPLFVMDFDTWQMYKAENFFNYFAPRESVAAYSQLKPAWQRYELLNSVETKVLRGIFVKLDPAAILSNTKLSKRFYTAYVEISSLVDELDSLVDRDLRYGNQWNHGYIINDQILAN
jgi:hypothetical protein